MARMIFGFNPLVDVAATSHWFILEIENKMATEDVQAGNLRRELANLAGALRTLKDCDGTPRG
jgi:hypothetical protein